MQQETHYEKYNFTELARKCNIDPKDLRKIRKKRGQVGFERFLLRRGYKYITEYKDKKYRYIIVEPVEILTKSEIEFLKSEEKKIYANYNPEKEKNINLFATFPKSEDNFIYFKLLPNFNLFQISKQDFLKYWTIELNFQKYLKELKKYDLNIDKFIVMHRNEYCFKVPKHLAQDFIKTYKSMLQSINEDFTLSYASFIKIIKGQCTPL